MPLSLYERAVVTEEKKKKKPLENHRAEISSSREVTHVNGMLTTNGFTFRCSQSSPNEPHYTNKRMRLATNTLVAQ
jgi:hypothetical protein